MPAADFSQIGWIVSIGLTKTASEPFAVNHCCDKVVVQSSVIEVPRRQT